MYLVLHFQRIQSFYKPFQSRRVPLSTFFDTMRLSPFFGTVKLFKLLIIFRDFLLLQGVPLSSFFDILQQNGCSKNPKGSPLSHFSALCDLPETSKKIRKQFAKIFSSIFSFLRAFVVSSCRKSGFVLLSLRYGADLGHSQLVHWKTAFASSQKPLTNISHQVYQKLDVENLKFLEYSSLLGHSVVFGVNQKNASFSSK